LVEGSAVDRPVTDFDIYGARVIRRLRRLWRTGIQTSHAARFTIASRAGRQAKTAAAAARSGTRRQDELHELERHQLHPGHAYAIKAREVRHVIERIKRGETVSQREIDHALDNSRPHELGGYP
jgi:hypothetical protein